MFAPTDAEYSQYEREGYFVRPRLLSPEEVDDFRDHARRDLESEAARDAVMEKGDKDGNKTLLKMWTTAANDKYGLLARDERLVRLATGLINREVYLYSHKMTMKQPGEGGAWEWHQDFGYWHEYGCLAPEMLSIWIALDKSTVANGCLQVLPETHRLGRLKHVREAGQTNVDPEFIAAALQRFPKQYVEMEAGDALVFHCNLLHRSDANKSDTYRWGYICSYNAVRNAPFKRVRDYGNYEKLDMVSAGSFMHAA